MSRNAKVARKIVWSGAALFAGGVICAADSALALPWGDDSDVYFRRYRGADEVGDDHSGRGGDDSSGSGRSGSGDDSSGSSGQSGGGTSSRGGTSSKPTGRGRSDDDDRFGKK